MHEMFKSANPKSLIDASQLIRILNNKDIEFSYKKRLNGKQGCYIGVKPKFNNGNDNSMIDDDDDTLIKKELKNALEKIKELEEVIKNMKLASEKEKKRENDIDEIINNNYDINESDDSLKEKDLIEKKKKRKNVIGEEKKTKSSKLNNIVKTAVVNSFEDIEDELDNFLKI